MKPLVVVLCAPSGTGKTTVARALLESADNLTFSVSATTRAPRPGERDGVDYHFVSRERFQAMREAGELLEWAEVHGELYGTPRSGVDEAARQGMHLILDIDVQGARQVVRSVSDSVTIFLLPPSAEVLLQRLRERGSEGGAELTRRLETARAELAAVDEFEYVLVNDELDQATEDVLAILRAEGLRQHRLPESTAVLCEEILAGLESAEL